MLRIMYSSGGVVRYPSPKGGSTATRKCPFCGLFILIPGRISTRTNKPMEIMTIQIWARGL